VEPDICDLIRLTIDDSMRSSAFVLMIPEKKSKFGPALVLDAFAGHVSIRVSTISGMGIASEPRP
jgi:hypothetical protein